MEIGAAITAILGVLAALIKLYISKSPERERKRDEKAAQKLRNAVETGDVVNVNAAVDGVPKETGDSSGQCNDSDIARRLAEITDK